MDLMQSGFLRALGWSLIDSVWQMGILWVLYLGITGNGRRFTAIKRHSLALLSIAGGSAWFLGELVFNLMNPGRLAFTATRETVIDQVTRFTPGLESALPTLALAYLLVCLVLFIRLIRQYRTTRSLATQGLQKICPELRLFTQFHSRQLNITRKIEIWVSANIDSPLTIGFWKPMILLPLAAINQLSIQQTEAIILHELNHIRRNDYLVNLVVAFATVVLFFNPFARLLAMILRNEREHCCDDVVIQFKYKPGHYAEALLLLERSRGLGNQVQLQATGTNRFHLFQRVRRILTGEPSTTPVSHRMLALFIGFLFVGFIGWYKPAQQLNEALIPSLADGFIRMETDADVVYKENKVQKPTVRSLQLLNAIRPAATPKPAPGPVPDDYPMIEADNSYDSETSPSESARPPVQFVTTPDEREFSIYETQSDPMPIASADASHPYVPASTLDFTFVEDTTVPKVILPSAEEVQAREAMEKAIAALDEIDWLKLQNELALADSKMDIAKLQEELKKAIGELNWKKINSQVKEKETELFFNNSALKNELQRYQQQRISKQQQLNEARQQMILDRLSLNEAKAEKCKKIISL
ncbi:MAG TPA: M56 family metallopeptidase [Flavitalea sp.]|nr:M56 family metallopeptidase [Flavitalea sp.]